MMPWPKPFFVKEKPKAKIKGYDCESCGLYKGCKSPKMEPTGEGRLGVLVVAESPGNTEDSEGIQLIGDAGQLLRGKLEEHGLDLDLHFWKTNVISCHPLGNREPKLSELKCCRPRLFKAIEELKPKMIWLMGNHALESYFMDRRLDNKKITLWRKRCIPDPLTDAWVIPMLRLSFMLRNQGNRNIESVYDRDLKWAIGQINKANPSFPSYEDRIKIITDYDELIALLNSLLNTSGTFVFDYETTGVKPHRVGNKIASIAFTFDGRAYSFPYQYPGVWNDKQLAIIKQKWINILISPVLKKVAHGLKFEDTWSRHIIGVQPNPWECCTMTTQHVLDDRTGCCGLKFQAFVRWGIHGYDEIIDPYKKETANRLNRMMEAPLMELLKYNALDALFEGWLYQEQQKELSLGSNKPLKEAADFFHEGLLTFVDMEQNGISVNMEYYKEEDERLEKEIKRLETKLHNSSVALEFEKHEGRKVGWGSNTDLPKLLFTYCKIKSCKKTASGKHESVDADALEMYAGEHPFLDDLITKRKLEKTKGTYLAQFIREEFNNKVYPIFNLHTARSMRSSANNPSFQNIPVRDEESKKSVRSGIIPSPGNKIMEIDFSSIEVCIGAAYTNDPVLMNYLVQGGDMHKDQAFAMFFLDESAGNWKEAPLKDIRFYAKNQWTFPQFYGSYFVSCARNLWSIADSLKLEDGKPLKQHLKEHRILTYQAFESHLERREKEFWDRFKVIKEWQDWTIDFYQKRGYVELFHGFRRAGLLDRNQILNTSWQGCLQRESLVETTSGWVPIKELVNKKVLVWTGFKWAEAVGVNKGKCQLATIELSSGLIIKCDIRHKLKTIHDKWIDFKDIKIGEWVALPKIRERVHPTENINWPFVLGAIIGDGGISIRKSPTSSGNHRTAFGICAGKSKYQQLIKIKEFIEKEFKIKLNVSITKADPKNNRQEKYRIYCEKKQLLDKLISFGLTPGFTARTKQVPMSIWMMSKLDQADFLNGLWKTDGYKKDKTLNMSNKKLLQQVQILSYGLGYDSYLTPNKLIGGGKLFYRQLNSEISKRVYPYNGFSDSIKNNKYKSKGGSSATILNKRVLDNKTNCHQHIAERIIKEIDPNKDIYRYDQIIKINIENTLEDTYTMIVNDDKHQFVADGVIHKNSAFHILLTACNKINKIRKEEKWKTKMPGQIHDSIFFDLNPSEEKHVLKTVSRIMTKDIPAIYKWINVPLKVEAEITDINESWYLKKPIENNL